MKHQHTISRGDLLRCVLRCPDAEDAVARLCGFVATRPAATSDPHVSLKVESSVMTVTSDSVVSSQVPRREASSFKIFAPVRYETQEDEQGPPVMDTDWLAERPVTRDELSAAPRPPDPVPLVPWSRLWPFLHRALGHRRAGRRLDLARLIQQLARLRPVRNVPRLPMIVWAPHASILIDHRRELAPFRTDFADLVRRLQRQRGRTGLHCERITHPGEIGATVAGPVLLLSDLGRLNRDAALSGLWLQYGARLNRRGIRAVALMPCPKSRWQRDHTEVFDCVAWDRSERLRYPPARDGGDDSDAAQTEAKRTGRLLDLLAPAIRIEPALLRAARLLLSPEHADVGTEFDAWHHQDTSRTADAMAIRAASALRRRDAFSQLDDDRKRAIIQLIRRAHRHWSISFFARETINLHECRAPVSGEDLELARQILRRFNKTMLEMYLEDPARARQLRLFEWQRSDFARSSPASRAAPEAAVAWELGRAWRGESVAVVPDEVDAAVVKQTQELLLTREHRAAPWYLLRTGSELAIGHPPAGSSAPAPLAVVPAVTPRFDVTWTDGDGEQSLINVLPRRDVPAVLPEFADAKTIVVRSDRARLELAPVEPPEWATRFGWDRYGLFADFEVAEVTFPLRWIPPGEFVMGSPDDEPARWDSEGPQRRVTIERGFWLGQTPVTQGQYAAVTGDRPSYFEHAGDRAPVEQVSWEDCRAFCEKLPDKLTGFESDLAFRLPSEAEWEYACRAGTATALYTGPLTIEGTCNGPELDAIAWYTGNSGVDYDGGVDSSDWPEKQYDHTRAGTHPVAQKAANPWGLYDMLGNVWEWCEDQWHDNYDGAPKDAGAWCDKDAEGSRRVDRGGSWANFARDCRCAFRFSWRPDDRNHDVGFRLVLAARANGDIRSFS